MREATKKDRKKVVKIIEESFINSPSVDWVVSKYKNRKKGLKVLAKYAFDIGFLKKGVYLSSDGNAIAICYKNSNKIAFLQNHYQKFKLFVGAIGFQKMIPVLKRQQYFSQQRPKDRDYFYFWFFGSTNDARGSGSANELQREIFEMANNEQLPIFIETSIRKNRIVYERFGFITYHTWHVEKENIDMWFMKREPEPL